MEEKKPLQPRTAKLLAAAVIGGTVLLLALLLFLVMRSPAEEAPAPASEGPSGGGQTEATEAPSSRMICILGEWEGKLAVFAPNAISPDEVYDVYISTLPEEEQRRLEEGIAVYDEQTLLGLLEDYTS